MLVVVMSRQMIKKPLQLRLSVAADSNFSTGNSLQSWLDLANLSVPLQSVTNGLTTSDVFPSGALNQPLGEVTNVSVSVSMLDLHEKFTESNQQPPKLPSWSDRSHRSHRPHRSHRSHRSQVTVEPGQAKPCCYSGIRCQKTSKTYSILFEVAFFSVFCDEKYSQFEKNLLKTTLVCGLDHSEYYKFTGKNIDKFSFRQGFVLNFLDVG
jgi:hypothetical protein